MTGRVLEWGNSFGIRLRKSDLEDAGLTPGEEVTIRIERKLSRIDLSGVPAFSGGAPEDSQRHDDLLGEARSAARRLRGLGP